MSAACAYAQADFRRKVLIEEFTTTDCVNCPAAHEMIEHCVGGNSSVVVAAHHSGFTTRTDPFPIPSAEEYLWFYGSEQISAPKIMIMRYNLGEFECFKQQGMQPGLTFNVSQAKINRAVNELTSEPADISVKILCQYNEAERTLNIKVNGEVDTQKHINDLLRMNVFLTEDSLMSFQEGGGMAYIHNHVMRANVTPVWGEPINFDGTTYCYTATVSLEPGWKPENMKAIAFVADYDEHDINNCKIHNCDFTPVKGQATGITYTKTDDGCMIVVYTLDGNKVAEAKSMEQLKHKISRHGIYLVKAGNKCIKIVL